MLQEIKRIQRVNQFAPDEKAFNVFTKKSIDSAHSIVRYAEDRFVNAFAQDVGGAVKAQSIYRQAQQKHLAIVNTAVSFLWARTAPVIGQTNGAGGNAGDPGSGVILNPTPQEPVGDRAKSVIAYPTLESLFGELDYCACEHCRSILSPAAYMVNLLEFLDPSVGDWQQTLREWKAAHDDVTYPYLTKQAWEQAGSPAPLSPLHVLLGRRPDVAHLPLTCENTNIPLPYIDVVNETLEHYVAHIENDQPLSGYEGHSTPEDVTSEELLAAPQFVQDDAYQKVQDDANKTLAEASFPLRLPFHQPLEHLRRYFTRFELNLSDVMQLLRQDDREVREEESDYGWTDILMEEISISRQAYDVLTNKGLKFRLWKFYGFADEQGDAAIRTQLANAKDFSRRMGISYEDVIAVLKTRMINPQAVLLPKLERLGVPIAFLTQLENGEINNEKFLEQLPKNIDVAQYGGNIPKWVKGHYAEIMNLILLTDPEQSQGDVIDHCSFDQFEFRYADGKVLKVLEPYKFIHLLRLKHLLGWSYEQVDQAIKALAPELYKASSRDALSKGFTQLVPRLGVLLRVIRRLGLNLQNDLPALLACFGSIETYGPTSLYRRMFLSSSLIDHDSPFADNGSGEFLPDTPNNSKKLLDHEETLRAAFSLTSEEFKAIVEFLKFNEQTKLTLENISQIFRHGWLAKQLRVSVVELLLVITRTGLDPFDLSDIPSRPILRLLQFFSYLRTTGLRPTEVLYLLWHEDVNGSSTPSQDEVLSVMRTIRADLVAIEQEFIVLDDPDGQKTREKMALVYGTDDTNRFFQILESQIVVDVDYTHHQNTLEEEIVTAGKGTITYDSFVKRLRFTGGVMTDDQWKALKGVDSFQQGITKFRTAIDELYRQSRQVFDDHPELEEAETIYHDFQGTAGEKQAAVLKALLPDLVHRRKQQQAMRILSSVAKVDTGFTLQLMQSVMERKTEVTNPEEAKTLFVLHADDNVSQPAVHDLTAIDEQGLSAEFYFKSAIAAGDTPDHTFESGAGLSYVGKEGPKSLPRHLTPGEPISGQWDGWLEVPQTGPIQFRIVTDATANVTFELNGETIPRTSEEDGPIWTHQFPLDLQAGMLYPISLKVEKVTTKMQVRWKTPMGSWEDLPLRLLYAKARVDPFLAHYIRFMKVASLANNLSLSAEELAYVGAQTDLRIEEQNWLNALPTNDLPTDSDHNVILFKGLLTLLNLARMKSTLGQQGAQLLRVLQDPDAKNEKEEMLLHTILRWAPESVDALLKRFKKDKRSALRDPAVFAQVYDVMRACQQCRVSATTLIQATMNDPSPDALRNFESAVRARYDHSAWLEVLKPIHDDLRRLRRDALVTYLLHRMHNQPDKQHIDTPEKLFEFFLMDVQMDPCMQTSRIRHALSSIQLFIERCLMNLEPQVAPSALDAKQWEWMKRYRVWEANRKVFLYPENWLEPELRDNQSPFFKEMMSELLQSDITEDRAATALLGYLSKLDEVAKLEPCGLHVQEGKEGTEDDIVHVVARTSGASRKYFYRRRNPSGWTPWEQIHLDIEDNPILPVVWNDRLFLFWLKILQQGPDDLGSQDPSSGPLNDDSEKEKTLAEVTLTDMQKTAQQNGAKSTEVSVQAVLCWSEHFNGKWQSARTSEINRPVSLGTYPGTGRNIFDRSDLRLSHIVENKGLRVLCSYRTESVTSYLLRNTHSVPRPFEYDATVAAITAATEAFSFDSPVTIREEELTGRENSSLVLHYLKRTKENEEQHEQAILLDTRILSQLPWILSPAVSLVARSYTPFFYGDNDFAFYVRVSQRAWLVGAHLSENWWSVGYGASWKVPQLNDLVSDISIPSPKEIMQRLGHSLVYDTAAMQQFVSNNAYIKKGLPGLGGVNFKGIIINPKGSIR